MDVTALVAELFFASKVEVALGRMGCPVRILTADEAGGLAASPPDLLILDLGLKPEVREAAVAAMRTAGRPVIAVGSHVDTESLGWARAAGCAEVLARGEVDRALGTLAAKHLARLT
jgi:AmiR/NasT family two-component response regulator